MTENMEIEIKPVVINQGGNQNTNGNNQMYRKAKKKFGRTYINILHDPRVVRGNTYAAFVIPSSLQQEFIRLKENEERQRRMMLLPKKLPRVASLIPGKKLNITTDVEEGMEEVEMVEPPKYQELDQPSIIEEMPYYHIDKPPTPKYIPLPPGVDVETQVEDGELFDFNLEVKPILEVLVGRSLVQARYELIEEFERAEYISHKVKYEQEREFELNNLQRMEASRIRRVNEQNRRQNQVIQKEQHNIIIQKKLYAKVFAKKHLENLKTRTLSHLEELGYLKQSREFNVCKLQEFNNYPQTYSIVGKFQDISNILNVKLEKDYKNKFGNINHNVIDKEKQRVLKNKQDKELAIKQHIENEEMKHQNRMKRKEEIRIERLTKKINDTIIKTKFTKNDILSLNIPLLYDEFKKKSDTIHSIGGLFGELIIILNEFPLVKNYLNQSDPSENDAKMIEDFFYFALEQTLLLLKENQSFDLTYVENIKIDLMNTAEEKKNENIEFLCDYRRICSKWLKLLIDNGFINQKVYSMLIRTIANLYYENKKDPATIVIDPENQEPEYLASIQKQQQEINNRNTLLEKLKSKIKISFEKVEYLKAMRNNYAAVIYVYPNKTDAIYNEEEEHLIENPPTEEVKPADSPVVVDANLNLSGDGEKKDGEKKDEDKIDEAKKEEAKDPLQEIIPVDVLKETFSTIDYVNSADVFTNKDANLDVYIMHEGVTDIYKIKILRKMKKFFDLEHKFNLEQQFKETNTKYNEYSKYILNYILTKETFKSEKIFKIDVIPPEPEPEVDANAIPK